jgi:protein-S-isoprenylcysteine O-methyltransferase Ste14
MDGTTGAGTTRPRRAAALPAYRWGDIGLCAFLALAAIVNFGDSLAAARAHEWLTSTHDLVVGLAMAINAALLIARGPAVARGEGITPRVAALLGSWLLSVLSFLPQTWDQPWILGGTTAAIILAYVFAAWALLTLRFSFSVFPEARRLVRTGPYALVRHPLYSVYILTYVCVLLTRLSPLAILVAAVGIGAEIWRARFEERLLGDVFPEYATYSATTPRFVPWLRRPARPARSR